MTTVTTLSDHARELHRGSIVIDAVCPHMSDPERWTDWISGGATVAAPTVASRHSPGETLAAIGKWHAWIDRSRDRLLHIRTVDDIRCAKAQGKLGVLFAFQDSTPVEWDLTRLHMYYALGVRMIGLCYNFRNRVGDGSGERSDAGLSRFGEAVVREMNRVGIVVDCSHTGYRTTMDAIDVSSKPPVFSHSNPRKLCDNGRNIWDDQARAVAAKGGLVGLGAFPAFVTREPSPTIEHWLDQMEYWIQLIGVDHVGIGLDHFRGATMVPADYKAYLDTFVWYEADYPAPPYPYPAGMEDASKLPNITEGLLRRGYSDRDVVKVLGENWMRVFEANWV